MELMQKPYQNLTKHNGTDAVMYLAKRYPADPDWINCGFAAASALKLLAAYNHIK